MLGRIERRLHAKDHARLLELGRRAVDETGACDREPVTALARFVIAQIDELARRVVRAKRYVEQAALVRRGHARHAFHRLRLLAVERDEQSEEHTSELQSL